MLDFFLEVIVLIDVDQVIGDGKEKKYRNDSMDIEP